MMNRITQTFPIALQSATAGMLAVLIASQSTLAAPRLGNLQRVNSPRATSRASSRAEALIRPTRPKDMEASEPLIGTEVIVERFPDGGVKIEREVTLDAEGNYVNHGPWRMWNKAGKLQAEGSYHFGKQTSIWTRWYDRGDSPLLSQQPFRRFATPFLSQTNFDNGVIDGDWSIIDAQQRRCFQISITQGKRNGMSLFWLPDGSVLQQSTFVQGVPTGDVLQLNTKTGKLDQDKVFLNGRQMVTKKMNHRRSRQPQSESHFLAPTSVQTAADDYWNLKFAKYEPQGEELRHGAWKEWHSNGQLKMSGQYDHDKMIGQFTHWHANGQKSSEGNYLKGKHDGNWVWWHANGQKSVAGDFKDGLLVNNWRWWAEDGKLTKNKSHNGTQTIEALADESIEINQNAMSKGRVQRK